MFTEEIKKRIANAIENYCEGITFLEFSADDLPKIVGDIEAIVNGLNVNTEKRAPNCETCKHRNVHLKEEPCKNCYDGSDYEQFA